MPSRIQVRRDTAENWTAADPVLYSGEYGYETDTQKLKIGDGATQWTLLSYRPDSADMASLTSDVSTLSDAITATSDSLTTHEASGTHAAHYLINTLDYPSVSPPAAEDVLHGTRDSDGAAIKIPWSAIPGAAPAMDSTEGVAGTDTIPGLVSADVLHDVVVALAGTAGTGDVDTVNSIEPVSGNVSLTQDDIPDGTTSKSYSATEKTKLAGIEAGASADTEIYPVSATVPTDLVYKATQATGAAAKLIVPAAMNPALVKNSSGGAITVHAPEGIVAAGAYFGAGVDMSFPLADNSWIPATTFNKIFYSFWIRVTTHTAGVYILSSYGGATSGFVELLYGGTSLATGYLQVEGYKAGGTATVHQRTTANIFPAANTWYHVMVAVDISTGSPTIRCYVNGSSVTFQDSGTWPEQVLSGSEVMQITGSALRLGKRGTGVGGDLLCAIAQMYMRVGSAPDLTDSSVRQKFYNSGPVNLGFSGYRPLAATPTLLMNADASAFAVNRALLPTATPPAAAITGTPASPGSVISGVSAAGTINGVSYVSVADGAAVSLIRINGTSDYVSV